MFETITEAIAALENRHAKAGKNTTAFERLSQCVQHEDLQSLIADTKVIHVAGTNGKGSTTNFMRSMLQEARAQVVTFTSPYLISHHDRIRLNGQPLSDKQLLHYIHQTLPYWEPYNLQMFEIDVLMSYFFARDEQADFLILETGIGGRLDATNICQPILSVITNISYDHMAMLGNTLLKIASEKAGIIKRDVPCVTAEDNPEIIQLFRHTAQVQHTTLYQLSALEVSEITPHSASFIYDDVRYEIKTVAQYQIKNAALAIAAIKLLETYWPVTTGQMQHALAQTQWAGRFEEIRPQLYIDGAHNISGIQALVAAAQNIPQPVQIIFAVLLEKQGTEMLAYLQAHHLDVVITTFAFHRNVFSEQDARELQIPFVANYEEAIERALLKQKQQGGSIIITGSLYFISEVRKVLLEEEEK